MLPDHRQKCKQFRITAI